MTICEEYVEEIDFDVDADFIGVTGKVIQGQRMNEVADEFRRRGKTVLIGGPHASLSPEAVRDHCDILIIGELESIAEDFFSDLENGNWKSEYVADKPDLSTSPLPKFHLYPNDRALSGCVQTSRGCPFECEFCDVIQYLGRAQRHKMVEQIITELDVLYDIGYRAVFLADDNFTVYRKRAKAVLRALADWNASRKDGPVAFHTQVSIDAARDPEIMRLCGEAGLTRVFIGIETPNEESLRETGKRQNVGINLVDQIQVFLDHGISVTGGMIVGFDHDGPRHLPAPARLRHVVPDSDLHPGRPGRACRHPALRPYEGQRAAGGKWLGDPGRVEHEHPARPHDPARALRRPEVVGQPPLPSGPISASGSSR